MAAIALTDQRTLNKCVQMDYNKITQKEMLTIIKKTFPNAPFVFKHYSTSYIIYKKNNSGNEILVKKGKETEKER